MSEPREIDCWHADELTCPYCGFECEIDPECYNGEKWECGKCKKNFFFEVDAKPLFTSKKILAGMVKIINGSQ